MTGRSGKERDRELQERAILRLEIALGLLFVIVLVTGGALIALLDGEYS